MASVTRFLVAGLLCASVVATQATARPPSTHAAAVRAAAKPAANPFDDQFTAPPLNPKWQWVHGRPRSWSLTAHREYLRIFTERGKDMSDKRTDAPLLLEKAPTGDYAITTSVAITPTQVFQQAGIILYSDDNNFYKLVYVHRNAGLYFVLGFMEKMGTMKKGKYNFMAVAVPPSSHRSGYYLQLDKKGVTYTAYASPDGIKWQTVNVHRGGAFTPARIGMLAMTGYGSTAPSIPADFDFIQERPLAASATGPLPVAK